MNDNHIIDPQNLPTWTAVGFTIALLALVVAFVGIYRLNMTVVVTQAEVLALNKKIATLQKPAQVIPQGSAAGAGK